MKKIKVGVLFGGRSAEHEVSLQSANNVIANLDPVKYDVIPIPINKQGKLYSGFINKVGVLLGARSDDQEICLQSVNNIIENLDPADYGVVPRGAAPIDVIFPVLHGPYGEDGTIQGFLKLVNVPFVGSGVLGSAIGMDKDVSKRLLREAGIPCAKGITVHKFCNEPAQYQDVAAKLGKTLFVKPANLGSSVGINKVNNKKDFSEALSEAFLYDNKVIIEEYVTGKEVECAVLGNEFPEASVLGEINPNNDFYCYNTKYKDPSGADLLIPAKLPKHVSEKIRSIAIKVFKILCCEGMARVDFFVNDNFEIKVNEVNTIPGFTRISMYPKLWEATNLSYSQLLDKLIGFALSRHANCSKLKTTISC